MPDIKSEITAASPDLEESNEETRMKIYNALLDPAKRKEVVISGKRGTGLVHGVSDVAHSLQADFNYKFLPIDLRNALGDVHTNTAMDLVKGLLPRGALMDILEPLSCLEEGMKKYQQATKRRLVLVVNNAQLILQLYNTEEREKLVVFLHHLATGNVADVVLVFGKQGFADEYMCLAGDLEMTNAKFIAPTNEKVKTYLTDEIADYMEENNLTFKGEYYNKLGSAYIECFGGGQLKVLKRAVKALKVRKVDGVGGFMDAVVEKKAQTNKELSDKIKQRKERMAARFEINRQITEWLKSEPWKSRVRLMLKGLDHDLRHSKIFRGQFF